jgi:hypothetical protein
LRPKSKLNKLLTFRSFYVIVNLWSVNHEEVKDLFGYFCN